jgi:lipopolysaccharide transport system ATP-binding protein
MEPIITVRDLGKCYTISHQGLKKRNDTLRDEMSGWFKNLTRKRTTEEKSSKEEFWALKDVSFDVNPGDRLGIIGRNGAGKSTLLKILSRITEPTTGEIKIKGRVASLLEVGTGFHQELTGRENIYLNGAILGMSRVEIKKKFDEIVAFSEVEKFLDTPVKRYSSGMYVRLAFAVAAHLEPEILIVDEVLAVGDAQFQKKCLGKMEDVSTKEGRTVLFVSHNIGAITALTKQVIWLNSGRIIEIGSTKDVVSKYNNDGFKNMTVWEAKHPNNNPMQIIRVEINSIATDFTVDKAIYITLDYIVREPLSGAVLSVILHASDGNPVLSTEDVDKNQELLDKRLPGKYKAKVTIPDNLLSSDIYLLRVHCGVVFQAVFDNIEALRFELVETGDPKIRSHKQAYFLPYLDWKTSTHE